MVLICLFVCVCVFRAELKRFIQEFRSSNGGSLNSMLAKDLVAGVTNLILNQQVRLESQRTL